MGFMSKNRRAERALLRGLGGGCQVPLGAAATVSADMLTIRAAVLDLDGKQRIEAEVSGPAGRAEKLGVELAGKLLTRGAAMLLGL